MKNLISFVLFLMCTGFIVAQSNTCNDSKKDAEQELNSITKCSISQKKNKTRQINVSISVSKVRFLKRRLMRKKNVSSVNDLYASGVNSLDSNSEELKNRILEISKSKSVDEIKIAEKFTTVDRIPTFDACKNTPDDQQLECFNEKMTNHINKYLSYPSQAIIKKMKGNVWIRFIISSDGNITNLKTLGPNGAEILDDEAKRVISLLPKFIPGKKAGKNVSVKYGFPINFSFSE